MAARTDLDRLPRAIGGGTLAEQLYTVLEQAIIEGSLAPGQRLHADDLAAHFGVSRIPLRETLRALDANGWIEIRPRQGAYVRERSVAELEQLFEVRLILETASVRVAAKRRTDEHLATLDERVARGREAVAAGDHRLVAQINSEFHQIVARCSGNAVLSELLEALGLRVRWYFGTIGQGRTRHSIEEHAEIVDALRRHDPDQAEKIVRDHIEATRDAVSEAVAAEAHAAG